MTDDGDVDGRPRATDGVASIEPPAPTAANPSTAQARVLLDELARCGVQHVVMCPGSRSTALVVAAAAHEGLRLHVAVDERGAGYLALGIGRATGEPCAVVVTSGTAVANLLPAVVEADHDRVPLLLLTADRPPDLHGVGANQTIQQLGIFGESPRWTVDVGVAGHGGEEVARWRWTACRAHGLAVGRPVEVPAVVALEDWQAPGPVHLNLPFREPTVPVADDGRTTARPFVHPLAGRAEGAPWATSDVSPHVPPDRVLADLAHRLAAEPRGLVVVGGGVPHPGPVATLGAALGWPVVGEPHVVLPPPADGTALDPRLASGSALLGDDGFVPAHRPRTVLRVGRPTVARATTQLLAASPRVVAVDLHVGWVDPDDERVELVRGSSGATVAALVEAVAVARAGEPADTAWIDTWSAADGVVGDRIRRFLTTEARLGEPAVAAAVLRAVPSGGRLVVGSSMPIRDLDLVGGRRDDVVVHANRGASGIDGTVATAFGIALGSGGPTVALMGDLTLLHDSTAWLLREDRAGPAADLVVVVVDNDGGGIFSFLPQRRHVEDFDRVFGTPHGVDLAHLAALHGLGYVPPDRLRDADALADEVGARARSGGRHLLHVRTDRDDNLALHERLRAEIADALRRLRAEIADALRRRQDGG